MLKFRCIKIIYLIFLSLCFFFSSLFISVVLNFIAKKIFPLSFSSFTPSTIYLSKSKTNKNVIPTYLLQKDVIETNIILEIIFRIIFITVMCYIFRNLISGIPFPLDGYYKFDHTKVTELSGSLLTILTFFFQNKLKNNASNLSDQFFSVSSS